MPSANNRGGAIGRRSLVAKSGAVAKKQIAVKTNSGGGGGPLPMPYTFPAAGNGSTNYTWTCPLTGWWKLVLWGCGGDGFLTVSSASANGGSGAYYEANRFFQKGQTVSLVVGFTYSSAPKDTTATLPGGEVLTAGAGGNDGNQGIGGTASSSTGGQPTDVFYNGTNAPTANGAYPGLGSGGSNTGNAGAGAPGNLPFRGGGPVTMNSGIGVSGHAPGGGGNGYASPNTGKGGDGLAIIVFYSV